MGILDLFRKKSQPKNIHEYLQNVFADVAPEFAKLPRERQSLPVEEYTEAIFGKLKIVNPKLPWTYLDALEALGIANPDISQGMRNVIELGNPGHYVDVVTVSKLNSKRAMEVVKDAASRIYTVSAGVDGLVNALLRQQCTTGALSSEMVLSENLSDGIEEIVLVNAKTIRWMRDESNGKLLPYQYTGDISSRANLTEDYVPLNPLTYTYYASDSLEGSPYALPPFAAVLSVIPIQIDMLKNIAGVVKKIGLVGFLSILLNTPQVEKGESQSAYRTRLQNYLSDAKARITSNFSEGIFIGYKQQHEFDHKDIGGDFRGVPEIIQVIEEQICSALNQDAFMLGRVYSTTESYAGVVYDKMLQSVGIYKRLNKRFLEKVYKMELSLKGVPYKDVSVTFKQPRPLNELQAEQARQMKLDNIIKEVERGFISWPDGARKAGYDAPFKSEMQVPISPITGAKPPAGQQPAQQQPDKKQPQDKNKPAEKPKGNGKDANAESGDVVATTDEKYEYTEFTVIQ